MKATTTPSQEFNSGAAPATLGSSVPGSPAGGTIPAGPPEAGPGGPPASAPGRANRGRADGLGGILCHRLGNGQILRPPGQEWPGPSFLLWPKPIPDLPPGITDGASWLWHLPSCSSQTVAFHITRCPSSIPFPVSLSAPDHF